VNICRVLSTVILKADVTSRFCDLVQHREQFAEVVGREDETVVGGHGLKLLRCLGIKIAHSDRDYSSTCRFQLG